MMNKFPALNLYRTIMTGVGGLIILGGVLFGLATSTDYAGRFSFMSFISVFGVAFFLAFSWLVAAEIIKVLIRIEDHLDHIRYVQERGAGLASDPILIPSQDSPTLLVTNMLTKAGSDGLAFLGKFFHRVREIVNHKIPLLKKTSAAYVKLLKTSRTVQVLTIIGIPIILVLVFVIPSVVRGFQVWSVTPQLLSQASKDYGSVSGSKVWDIVSIQKSTNKVFPDIDPYCVAFTPPLVFRNEDIKNVLVAINPQGQWQLYLGQPQWRFKDLGCNNWKD